MPSFLCHLYHSEWQSLCP